MVPYWGLSRSLLFADLTFGSSSYCNSLGKWDFMLLDACTVPVSNTMTILLIHPLHQPLDDQWQRLADVHWLVILSTWSFSHDRCSLVSINMWYKFLHALWPFSCVYISSFSPKLLDATTLLLFLLPGPWSTIQAICYCPKIHIFSNLGPLPFPREMNDQVHPLGESPSL